MTQSTMSARVRLRPASTAPIRSSARGTIMSSVPECLVRGPWSRAVIGDLRSTHDSCTRIHATSWARVLCALLGWSRTKNETECRLGAARVGVAHVHGVAGPQSLQDCVERGDRRDGLPIH